MPNREAPEAKAPVDPTRRPPEQTAASHTGVTPQELELLLHEEDRPRDPSQLEPLAGPLPLTEGGEILEPLSVPMPAPGSATGGRRPAAWLATGAPDAGHRTARGGDRGSRDRQESFWRFGADTTAPRGKKIVDWGRSRW